MKNQLPCHLGKEHNVPNDEQILDFSKYLQHILIYCSMVWYNQDKIDMIHHSK